MRRAIRRSPLLGCPLSERGNHGIYPKERRSPNRRCAWEAHEKAPSSFHWPFMRRAIRRSPLLGCPVSERGNHGMYPKERRSPNRRCAWEAHENALSSCHGPFMRRAIRRSPLLECPVSERGNHGIYPKERRSPNRRCAWEAREKALGSSHWPFMRRAIRRSPLLGCPAPEREFSNSQGTWTMPSGSLTVDLTLPSDCWSWRT
jgi:hypothetical protein